MCTSQIWILLLLLIYICVTRADYFFSDFNTEDCKDICADSYFQLPKGLYAQSICERGCRFFNIINFKDDQLNITKEECYISCQEAYDENQQKEACNTGCDAMLKKKESELAGILTLIELDSSNNVIFAETDLELSDSELVVEPVIRETELRLSIGYKIPATEFRTMPIQVQMPTKRQVYDYWMRCTGQYVYASNWLQFGSVLWALAFLVPLMLWCVCKVEWGFHSGLVECEKEGFDDGIVHGESKDEQLLEHVEEVSFSTPPKYSTETEKV